MYAFVHIEKTGGTTLHSILRHSFGARHCDIRLPLAKRVSDRRDFRPHVDGRDLRRARRIYRNLRGIAGHNVRAYSDLHVECPEIQFFTFLREPAGRYRSHYLNFGDHYTVEDFDRWFSDDRLHNWQTKMLAGEPNAEKAIDIISKRFGFVGLTERFDESLLLMGDWWCDTDFCPEYRRLNESGHQRSADDLALRQAHMSYLDSDEGRAKIAAANTEDYKVYDFVTKVVYPRQIAAYAGDLEADVCRLRERNRSINQLAEPSMSILMRNYVYKPLIHCHVV
jgi:hypothetical protein